MKKVAFFVVLVLIGIGGFLAYKAYTSYNNSDYEAEGFLICNADNTVCENSQHIHSDIKITSCGSEIFFEKEKGNVSKQHTHKEQNKIHWHAREKVDPKTHQPLDRYPRTLAAFFEQMEFKIPDSCQNGVPATLTLKVNGSENAEKLDYMWVDGDELEIEIK